MPGTPGCGKRNERDAEKNWLPVLWYMVVPA